MKKKDFDDNLLNKEKKILNDISDENIIYEETQIGPQEEPFLFEFHVDLEAWEKYKNKNKNKNNCHNYDEIKKNN